VPLAQAFGVADAADLDLDDIDREAMAIVFGTFEGGTFDFGAMRWKEKNP
jgi:hypothetical protein